VPDVLTREGIRVDRRAADRWDAVRQCGAVLAELGATDDGYVRTMLERERSLSTYIGEGVAIPHGTDAARVLVRRTTIAVLQYPLGVDWDGHTVRSCVTIAARGDEHLTVLSALALLLMEPDRAARLRACADPDEIHQLLRSVSGDVAP
jgi:PTS system mannitol-specific IIA component/phosphocarrier protein FPr